MEQRNQDRHARAQADHLLSQWEQRTLLAVLANARSANRYAAWELWLGGIGAALTAAVGTGIFATLEHAVSTPVRVGVGLVTVAAAVCTALHTFAAFGQRQAVYEAASRRQATVRRRIELVRARLAAEDDFDYWTEVQEIRVALDEASSGTPNASRRIFDRTRRELKNELTRWDRIRRFLTGHPRESKLGKPDDYGGPLPPLPAETDDSDADRG